MNNLSEKKCIPCSGKTPKLSILEINSKLSEIQDWKINNDKEMIYKKFNFNNFKKALQFANRVGDIAEIENHHPDISLGWAYCLIIIHTHAIKGLSENDFILAAKIDKIS